MSALAAGKRNRRIAWLAGTLAVLLLAYAVLGFYAVPRIARTQAEAFVTGTLGRKVAIGEIAFNPFTLAADIRGFRLTEADGAPIASFEHLHVNAELASLWRRGLVLKDLALAAPDVEAILGADGSLNLARLAPPAEPAQPPQPEDAAAGGELPLRVHIGKLAVTDGRVGFQDRSRAQPFAAAFSPIRFSLTDFRTDLGHRNAYSFAASSSGGRLEWEGGFTVQPVGSSGTFTLSDVRLTALDDYLAEKLPVEVASGSAAVRGRYRFQLNPLSVEVTLPTVEVRDLALAERGAGSAAPVVIPQVDVKDVVVSLTRRDVGIGRIEVRGARIDVAREADGSLSLARLAGAPAAPAAAPAPASAAAPSPPSPWTVHADLIAVEEATVVAEDRTTSPPARLRLAPIGIAVNGWTTAPGSRMGVEARVGIDGTGHLGVKGEVGVEPPSAAVGIDLQKFPLPVLQPYLSQATALTLHAGTLGVKGNFAFAPPRAGEPPAAKVSGQVRIDDLRASDALAREDLVKWRSLTVSGIQFQQRPERLRIERIVAQEPYARMVIAEDGTTNVGRALARRADGEAAPPPPPPEPKTSAAPPLAMEIRTVQVIEGSAHFADHSVRPSFASGIVGLAGQVEGLSSDPASRAKVAIKGRVDEFSPVELAGEVNLLSASVFTDLALDFRNIELTTFNPYSGKFAGYNIGKGKLSTALKYRVEQRKLDAQHRVVVDQLEFGEKTDSKDAAPIPVKLAVALLKDRRGIIDLELPVSGTLDDPEFRLGPLIWKVLLNLLAKAVAAPFAALGALFGGGADLAFVDFQPGSAALGEAAARNLGTLSKALVERPQLRLNVPLTVAAAADGEAAAAAALRALVPPLDPARPLDEAAKRKRLEALEAAYLARLKVAPAYPVHEGAPALAPDAKVDWLQAALLEHLKPPPAELEALARQRAEAVRRALLANQELSAERVFIVSRGAEPASAAGVVRMEMQLE